MGSPDSPTGNALKRWPVAPPVLALVWDGGNIRLAAEGEEDGAVYVQQRVHADIVEALHDLLQTVPRTEEGGAQAEARRKAVDALMRSIACGACGGKNGLGLIQKG